MFRVDQFGVLMSSGEGVVFNYETSAFLLAGFCGLLFVINASKKTLIFLPAFCLLASWEAFNAFHASQSLSGVSLSFVATGLFLTSQGFWFVGNAKKALVHPEYRWWNTPPRFLASAPAQVRTHKGSSYISRVMNLSDDGLLIDLPSVRDGEGNFRQGQLLDLRFQLEPLKIVHCRAEVVRKDQAENGERYGLRVVQMGSESRKKLRQYMKNETVMAA